MRQGWGVIPVSRVGKKKALVRGKGTRDPDMAARWWRRFPDANVGVVLDFQSVVVLDPDGPLGEHSLQRLLDRAGVALPDTYVVATGREGGGRHLYFLLAEGCAPLVTQYGSRKRHPKLDIKFRGFVVAPGSIHETGKVYTANRPDIPAPEDFAVLPTEVYEVLRAIGAVWVPDSPPKSSKARRKPAGALCRVSAGLSSACRER